jgi:hypothetical protein
MIYCFIFAPRGFLFQVSVFLALVTVDFDLARVRIKAPAFKIDSFHLLIFVNIHTNKPQGKSLDFSRDVGRAYAEQPKSQPTGIGDRLSSSIHGTSTGNGGIKSTTPKLHLFSDDQSTAHLTHYTYKFILIYI